MTFQTNMDCIHEVLKFLRHDTESLHSCLLVNRLWCELSVPILWKDPWARFFNMPFSKPSFTQPTSLINTYISSLPRESILKLEKNGFNVSSISSSTTFNYPMYLRCLDLEFLYWLVMKWVQNKSKPGFRPLKRVVRRFKKFRKKLNNNNSNNLDSTSMPPQDKIRLVCSELLTLFLKESPKIYILRINDYSKVDVFGQLGEALANLNPKNNCLSSLKGLECRDKPVMDNIFEMLSLLTTDISQILIMGNYNTKTLANLIRSQKKLEKVCFENFHNMSPQDYWESGVGYELSKKAHFITSLHLLNSCSLLAKLSDFVNLQELTLQCIHEQSCEYTDSLTSANIPILRDIAKLKFRCKHEYSLEYLSNLIDKSNGKLRKITIEGSRIKDRRYDLLMSTIANKCPNLKSCSIPISRIDPQIDRLLESCEQLKDLKLCAVLDTSDNDNNDILLYQLLNCTPTRLRRLDFVDWKFSISAWELFLKTQSRTLLQRICYYWNDNSKIASPSDEFLKACQQNKRDGILATYKGIDSYWKCIWPKLFVMN
ncbi:hypothetical protein F8M41_025270 [Gigaspora margarita]|uniref:F-box domain-containing protein n=1 Tax=Gigaspora margarita TaxID=4874 RepID=A0A8H3XIR7_GIGMA|nr:hypothetical protein F8M41_025270 [Gigaspora margarita]